MQDIQKINYLLTKREELQKKLFSLAFDGTPEIKVIAGNNYLYTRKRENGKLKSKYIGEFSYDLYHKLLKSNQLSKQFKNEIKLIEKELKQQGCDSIGFRPNKQNPKLKKLILISEPHFIGKTCVARKLFESYKNSAYLNGDWCWCVNSFDHLNKRNINGDRNMSFILSNYLNSDFDYVFFSSVDLVDNKARENIINDIYAKNFKIISFTLKCSEETSKGRHVLSGNKGETNNFCQKLKQHKNDFSIDADNKSILQVCDEIKIIINNN